MTCHSIILHGRTWWRMSWSAQMISHRTRRGVFFFTKSGCIMSCMAPSTAAAATTAVQTQPDDPLAFDMQPRIPWLHFRQLFCSINRNIIGMCAFIDDGILMTNAACCTRRLEASLYILPLSLLESISSSLDIRSRRHRVFHSHHSLTFSTTFNTMFITGFAVVMAVLATNFVVVAEVALHTG